MARNIWLSLAIAAAVTLPAAAYAQGRNRAATSEDSFHDWTEAGFASLDHNRDGVITPDEWHWDRASFRRVDVNNDGVLSRDEFLGTNAIGTNGRVESFEDLDLNHDGCITRDEYDRATASARDTRQSVARNAGYERGLIEGRQAGREDKQRNQGWDLEGQRELETADSGYEPRMGSRAEYQTGYREGFRRGYREGWNQK